MQGFFSADRNLPVSPLGLFSKHEMIDVFIECHNSIPVNGVLFLLGASSEVCNNVSIVLEVQSRIFPQYVHEGVNIHALSSLFDLLEDPCSVVVNSY